MANFNQIMGGVGVLGFPKALAGMHDWLGFTQFLDAWEAVDEMTFSLTFTSYYEAALRELSTIRPFRMSSVAALPSLEHRGISHVAVDPKTKKGMREGGTWPKKCAKQEHYVVGKTGITDSTDPTAGSTGWDLTSLGVGEKLFTVDQYGFIVGQVLRPAHLSHRPVFLFRDPRPPLSAAQVAASVARPVSDNYNTSGP